MKPSEFDYDLPPERIAQRPAPERDASRLLVLKRAAHEGPDAAGAASAGDEAGAAVEHAVFRDIGRFLRAGDLLVVNDTRVLPARLVGSKESGGRIELLLVEAADRREPGPAASPAPAGSEEWLCLAGFSRAPAIGARLELGPGLEGRYLGRAEGEMHRVRLLPRGPGTVRQALDSSGRVPLPPYIARNGEGGPEAEDAARYQTVFAEREGAVAAPTAGLHFTDGLLRDLRERGIGLARITLHVGPATFLPVRVEDIEDHPMPSERYEVTEAAAAAVNGARAAGGRVVAVGTTVVRALESASDGRGGVLPARGRTDLFLYPGSRFRSIDGLVTNFHLPRSTLLMLVCAFAGRERVLSAYRQAVAAGYRFYSYGDAMLAL